LIQAGDAEVLRDEITLLAHKASLAGVKVEHEIFEVGYSVSYSPTLRRDTDRALPLRRAGLCSRLPSIHFPRSLSQIIPISKNFRQTHSPSTTSFGPCSYSSSLVQPRTSRSRNHERCSRGRRTRKRRRRELTSDSAYGREGSSWR
jgi:hypothetical protein